MLPAARVSAIAVSVSNVGGEGPGQYGAHRRHGRHRPGLVQPHIPAQLQRLPIRQPGGMHLPAYGVENDFRPRVIPVRPRLPEIGNAGINQPRIDPPQRFVPNPQPLGHARTVALHHNIGPLGQPPDDRSGGVPLQIQRNAALVRVQMQKQPALFGMGNIPGKGPDPPRPVPRRRVLHLDNIRPVVRQQLDAVGAGDVVRKIEYLQPGQGTLGSRHHRQSSCVRLPARPPGPGGGKEMKNARPATIALNRARVNRAPAAGARQLAGIGADCASSCASSPSLSPRTCST